MKTLVTFLGKGSHGSKQGYRRTRYEFPDHHVTAPTPYFGLALTLHLKPDVLVVLGTSGSMWGALVEDLATQGEDEDLRLRLLEAEEAGTVNQDLLDAAAPLLRRTLGLEVRARLIPFGRNDAEQGRILGAVAQAVPVGQVEFDLTHGFRHLGMVGLLSAFMLERIGKLDVRGLWYGALDMSTDDGRTPVLKLDGLNAIQRWIAALDRFDASGDYGVFAPLLLADGVPADKARSLEEAAFHERTHNVAGAHGKLSRFLPVLDAPLGGASALFRERLRERLAWVKTKGLAEHQRLLACEYLKRKDFLRAATFAYEAAISKKCREDRLDPLNYFEGREPAKTALDGDPRSDDYRTLKNLRNALAHGTPSSDPRVPPLLESSQRLHDWLKGCPD